ncbi:MAG: hypothetical protein K1X54_02570 [Flavobacteriales bacterium]|nr:hypothetical protein [Flavobacteriales bacterium]
MRKILLIAFSFFLIASCKKTETVTFTNNNIPEYTGIPTLLVENYVNRLFIDLIGREPTNEEMGNEVAALEAGGLSSAARSTLVDKLMTSTAPIDGDTSYAHAYAQKFYDDNKARLLDGIAENQVYEEYYLYYAISTQDSLAGNMLAYEINRDYANRSRDVLKSKEQFRLGQINCAEMCRRMCYNTMYDNLHMGSFNYINATFDDLFYRFPTDVEMDEAYDAVEGVPSNGEGDISGYLFGELFSTKKEYLNVLIDSDEFAEGLIRWSYLSLLSREPSTTEVYNKLSILNNGMNIRAVQKSILVTDEYAGFNE